jgi:predicted acyltransferase
MMDLLLLSKTRADSSWDKKRGRKSYPFLTTPHLNWRMSPRDVSLDVFRGIVMIGMIMVDNQGNFSCVFPSQFEHSEWEGTTLADMVFPSFLFAMGAAIPYALASRNISARATTQEKSQFFLRKILLRSILLIAIGAFLNLLALHFDIWHWRFMGILQRLGICYFFTSLFIMMAGPAGAASVAFVSLFLYFMLCLIMGGGGANCEEESPSWEERYSQNCTLAGWVDQTILTPPHMLTPNYDPEGLLGSIPSCFNVAMGALVSYLQMLVSREERADRFLSMRNYFPALLLVGASSAFVANYSSSILDIPMIKSIWTVTFAMYSVSFSVFLLGVVGTTSQYGYEPLEMLHRNLPESSARIWGVMLSIGKSPFYVLIALGRNPLLIFIQMILWEIVLLFQIDGRSIQAYLFGFLLRLLQWHGLVTRVVGQSVMCHLLSGWFALMTVIGLSAFAVVYHWRRIYLRL